MFRWLVSAVFLALPIGSTIGILMGLQAYRHANGQPPPFSGDDGGNLPGTGGGNGGFKGKDRVEMACDIATGLVPATKGESFIMNPNPWGWEKGDPGHICMSVDHFGNGTYASNTTAAPWNITWQYPVMTGKGNNNVWAFPNAKVDSPSFPCKLGDITTLGFDAKWYLGFSNDTLESASAADMTAQNVGANIAIDMFMDSDKKISSADQSTKPKYEVMVWFAVFGPAAQPLGMSSGKVTSMTLGSIEFELYAGQNAEEQEVLTWVATQPAYEFSGSLMPLLDAIFKLKDAKYPTQDDYIGYLSFGQEAYSSNKNLTLSVPQLSVDVRTS